MAGNDANAQHAKSNGDEFHFTLSQDTSAHRRAGRVCHNSPRRRLCKEGGSTMAEWNIHDEGFKNVSQNGRITGFQLKIQTSYYRGIALSLIEGFEVTVDGENLKQDQIKFGVGNRAYALSEMENLADVRWPWLEPAVLTVNKTGGLKPGLHDVQVVYQYRVSYMEASPSVATFNKKLTMVV
jgi:hypothetical protein